MTNVHRKTYIILGCIGVAVVIALGLLFLHNQRKDEPSLQGSGATTYAECRSEEGSIILETYPDQCQTKDKKTFTNPSQSVD